MQRMVAELTDQADWYDGDTNTTPSGAPAPLPPSHATIDLTTPPSAHGPPSRVPATLDLRFQETAFASPDLTATDFPPDTSSRHPRDSSIATAMIPRLQVMMESTLDTLTEHARALEDAAMERHRRSTVVSNTSHFREIIRKSQSMGFEPPYSSPGPLPPHDHCGCKLAILMVAKSLEPGRHSATHKQWDTVRKLRATYSNQIRASAVSNSTTLTLSDNKGSGYERITVDACGSLWFNRFMTGCKNRMCQDCRPKRTNGPAPSIG